MKKNSLTVMCVFALLAVACGKQTTVSAPGAGIQITKNGDVTKFELKTDRGEKMVVAGSGGQGLVLPANFPADVPIMPESVVRLAIASGNNLSVHFGVKATQADAMKYYENNLKANGWQIESSMNMGPSSMVSAKKGKRECVLNVVTESPESIVVQVMVPGEKS